MEKIPVIEEGELPSFAEDGTDLTLIRWMLSLSPRERLQVLQDHVNMVEGIREANGTKSVPRDPESAEPVSG